MVADAGHILLEGAPGELDTRAIGPDLIANIAGVHGVHHVHVWSITQARRMVTLHVCVERVCRFRSDRARRQGTPQGALRPRPCHGRDRARRMCRRHTCQGELMTEPLIKVEDLSVDFSSGDRVTHAVKHVSFDIGDAETVALVGEFGLGQDGDRPLHPRATPLPCRLAPIGRDPVQGDEPAGTGSARASARFSGNKISMIFQEPMTSLNPLHTIEQQIGEVLKIHRGHLGPWQRASGCSTCSARLASTIRKGRLDSLSAPALGRPAAAGDDRHGARQRARPADRR